jgi:uncharacterized membrane protein
MQATWSLQLLGWVLLIMGIVFIVVALSPAIHRAGHEEGQETKSRGFILIGPIPIVWGFGKRGWLLAAIVLVAVMLIWLISMT